ncbi:VOC family protein [Glycomyces terrestris]|uniref:VOC family protein n=1 Tax=Glycomyces terrestris TaxID=2493553 RepID=A0A426V3V5_9ACTN|nr:VOC family protein [Glycomyces terrestris]RRS01556.1 VOC family protein [Glycomyces terrestris]
MTIRWATLFLDFPAPDFEAGTAFWLEAAGATRSEPWGRADEFATLEPPEGDACLSVQRLGTGGPGLHPDFHVTELDADSARARELGAAVVSEQPGLRVFTSPAGAPFCFVRHREGQSATPPPARWAGGRSRPDQICLDVPPGAFEDELAFWRALTGWPQTATDVDEFRRLLPPRGFPVHFLLQRLDDAAPGAKAKAHLDFSCDDVDAETARHVAAGARALRRHRHWQVMRDPVGLVYCLTDKDADGAWLARTRPLES